MNHDAVLARAIAELALPLEGRPSDLDPLIDLVGDARFVLIGEATHGTHEFYALRAELTARLVDELGFSAVAAEADFPDAWRVCRYVQGRSDDPDPQTALADFIRFPAWMWRNADVVDFVRWLRDHNHRALREVGFHGLDLYSLHASMEAVVEYLSGVDEDAANDARARYRCFDQFGATPEDYALAVRLSLHRDCEAEVVAQLAAMQHRRAALLKADGIEAEDAWFAAEQNARVVVDAEAYYRNMFAGEESGWNLRDTHMADTLDALVEHLSRREENPKVVVWAHNSHVGDARATEASLRGELNLGQLVRERHPGEVITIGFTTFQGTVTAASDWGGEAERKTVRPALPGSYEALFHQTGLPGFVLPLQLCGEVARGLAVPRLERAIGVVYRPGTERASHYLLCALTRQFDAVIHVDESAAVIPLERTSRWDAGEEPETWPTGI